EEEEIADLGESQGGDSSQQIALTLVGKLLIVRSYNFEALQRTLKQVWSPSRGVVFRKIENNLLIIQFFHWKDRKKVLDGAPWNFDNQLLVLKQVNGGEQPENNVLNHCPFWVRIYNLPLDSRSDEDVKLVASKMGEVLEVEVDKLGWEKSRRVWVLLHISKPLRRSQTIRNKQGAICIVHYKYERLPIFCFLCGTLGHTDKDCSGVEEDEGDMEKRWGLWLRASPRKGRLCMTEEVSKLVGCKKALSFVPKPETHACTDKGRGTISMEKRGVDTRNLVVGGGIELEGRANDLTSTFSVPKEYNDHVSAIRTTTPEVPTLKEGESGGSSGDNGDDDILPTPGFEVGSGGRARKGGSGCQRRWKKLARRIGCEEKRILPVLGDKRLREDAMEIEEVGSGKRGLFETSVVAEAAAPSLAFLAETKLSSIEFQRVHDKLGDYDGLAVDSMGRSGGSGNQGPWCCLGDFNEILYDSDKQGGNDRVQWQMTNFREAVDVCGFREIPFKGYAFTYDNGREGEDNARRNLVRDIEGLVSHEEIFWRQRSRVLCLEAGDRNTSFFHRRASGRRKRNSINYLIDDNGQKRQGNREVERVTVNYFMDLFSSSGVEQVEEALRGYENLRVCDLLLPSTSSWNVDLVNNLFLPFERERIIAIPLSDRRPVDVVCWDIEKNGLYSVSSAYRLIFGDGEAAGCSLEGDSGKQLWNMIWHSPMLPRIKIFMWRACRDALPTKAGLGMRIPSMQRKCDICGASEETILHSLLSCPLAGAVTDVIHNLDGDGRIRVMMVCWVIWGACNRRLFEGEWPDPVATVAYVDKLMGEVASTFKGERIKAPATVSRWCAPPRGLVKVNVDAGLLGSNALGVGVVAQDDEGAAMFCASVQMEGHLEPRCAEARAILVGIQMAMEMGFDDVIIENDCEGLINALSKGEKGHSSFHLLLEDILLLVSSLRSISWSFVKREANKIAHALAHLAPWVLGRRVWLTEFPPHISNLLSDD
ncbi:hypothetical protein RDABS01_004436, partial [Bienertia sinuspersici]